MKLRISLLLFTLIPLVQAQEKELNLSVTDSLFKEDQFYISLTYNILVDNQSAFAQRNFSLGLHAGMIRDFPINKKRTWALGVGVGLSANSYIHNLQIQKTEDTYHYEIKDFVNEDINKNKFSIYTIEVPLEIRWRNATETNYTFWRIYTGFKMGYIFYNTYKFTNSIENYRLNNLEILDKIRYGVTLSVGYEKYNIYVYMGLNNLFKKGNVLVDSKELELTPLKLGLIVYIF